jgi:hypothetical protein
MRLSLLYPASTVVQARPTNMTLPRIAELEDSNESCEILIPWQDVDSLEARSQGRSGAGKATRHQEAQGQTSRRYAL